MLFLLLKKEYRQGQCAAGGGDRQRRAKGPAPDTPPNVCHVGLAPFLASFLAPFLSPLRQRGLRTRRLSQADLCKPSEAPAPPPPGGRHTQRPPHVSSSTGRRRKGSRACRKEYPPRSLSHPPQHIPAPTHQVRMSPRSPPPPPAASACVCRRRSPLAHWPPFVCPHPSPRGPDRREPSAPDRNTRPPRPSLRAVFRFDRDTLSHAHIG